MSRTGLLAKGGRIGKSVALLLVSITLSADTLGFVEQKFSYLSFDRGRWERTEKLPCYVYSAKRDGATVEMLRIGGSNLVPFKAPSKGLTVTVCGDTAAFAEGFEAGLPMVDKAAPR